MESYYEPLVARTAAYIREHFAEEFNLSALAEAMGIGKHYLCHIFKQVTDISMLTYRNTYRLTVAKQLLYTTDLPITDIGAQCGFETHSYFARIFKENEHITPSEFRRLHQRTVK